MYEVPRMYFYAGPAKILSLSRSLDERVIALVPNRRSTLFAVLKSRSFELWSIRVSPASGGTVYGVIWS